MKILVIGGYGVFGKRIVTSLFNHYDYELVVAGRSAAKAQALIRSFPHRAGARLGYQAVDVHDDDLAELFNRLAIDLVVNASGPFHLQQGGDDYRVARACIESGADYVDMADDRRFVGGFVPALGADAAQAGITLVTGASTVPGLSAAVLNHYQPRFASMKSINYGISPGNRTQRGKATVASILSYTGQPFTTLVDGQKIDVYGWQDLRRYDFRGPLKKRWMGNCNIPDLDLLPARYPELNSIRFQAGLEVSLLHLGLWLLALPVRLRLVENLSGYSGLLLRMSDCFVNLGSDCGGMFVEIDGVDSQGLPKRVSWQLVAENAVGPNVPTIAVELVVARIAGGKTPAGAFPCMDFFTLPEFMAIASRWGIYQKETIHDQKSC